MSGHNGIDKYLTTNRDGEVINLRTRGTSYIAGTMPNGNFAVLTTVGGRVLTAQEIMSGGLIFNSTATGTFTFPTAAALEAYLASQGLPDIHIGESLEMFFENSTAADIVVALPAGFTALDGSSTITVPAGTLLPVQIRKTAAQTYTVAVVGSPSVLVPIVPAANSGQVPVRNLNAIGDFVTYKDSAGLLGGTPESDGSFGVGRAFAGAGWTNTYFRSGHMLDHGTGAAIADQYLIKNRSYANPIDANQPSMDWQHSTTIENTRFLSICYADNTLDKGTSIRKKFWVANGVNGLGYTVLGGGSDLTGLKQCDTACNYNICCQGRLTILTSQMPAAQIPFFSELTQFPDQAALFTGSSGHTLHSGETDIYIFQCNPAIGSEGPYSFYRYKVISTFGQPYGTYAGALNIIRQTITLEHVYNPLTADSVLVADRPNLTVIAPPANTFRLAAPANAAAIHGGAAGIWNVFVVSKFSFMRFTPN